MAAKTMMVRPYVLLPLTLSHALPYLFAGLRKKQLVFETQSIRLVNSRASSNECRNNLRLEQYDGLRRFTARATNFNSAGTFDSPLMQSMENKIKEQLNAESVSVKDASGDGRHVSIDVISSSFEGQSAVNRQRMVYKAIWEELQTTVHAVDQMTTKTPSEVSPQK